MSKKVYFYLTDKQEKILAPLFEQVHESNAKGERGLIFAQIKEEQPSIAAFIPEKYGIKMNEIMQEMKKDIS